MDRPFNQIRDIFRKSNEQSKELAKYIFEKSDNISLWIIGLAIGGISIIANNFGEIKNAIDPRYLKPILILLALSVACGIIYRIFYLYLFVVLNNVLRGIDISFSREETMDTESLLTGDESFESVLKVIKDGFNKDMSHLIPLYDQGDDNVKSRLHQDMISYYEQLVAFAQKDFESAIDFVADTYSVFTGTKKEKYLKRLKKGNPSGQYRWTVRATLFFYITYLITFIGALFLFVASA